MVHAAPEMGRHRLFGHKERLVTSRGGTNLPEPGAVERAPDPAGVPRCYVCCEERIQPGVLRRRTVIWRSQPADDNSRIISLPAGE
jgi:hypothetical protein